MRISLRFKLVLISLLLLAIPYSGLRLAAIIKNNLLESRREALMFSARAVASALSGREGLFDRELFHSLNQGRDLYLFRLTNPMRLNGKTDDWQPHLANAQYFGENHLLSSTRPFDATDFSFTHLVGKRGKYLYAVFQIKDDVPVFRQKNSLALDRADHLQIAVEDRAGKLNRYIIAPNQPGWVNGFLTSRDFDSILPAIKEPQIQSVWEITADGYIIEMRIPLRLVGKRLAFAVADVDDSFSRETESVIGTAGIDDPGKIGWLLTKSTHIEDILRTLNQPQSKIQIVDSSRHIRASYGSLAKRTEKGEDDQAGNTLLATFNSWLAPLYRLFAEPTTTDFTDPQAQPAELNREGVRRALAGESSIFSYAIADGDVEVMAAATTLYENEEIVGAVVVEQTTNSILALQNRVIEESVGLTLLVLLFGGGGLLFFAVRISSRIRLLRDQAENAVGDNGRILFVPSPTRARDEIGDLSRTLHSVLTQLQAQGNYREKMADNLEHEMRTPLAGASASLKNLAKEMAQQPEHIRNYISWAIGDIKRMENLLTDIRDATSLNRALQHDYRELFNLSEALTIWLAHSWQKTFSDVEFVFARPENDVHIQGDPDRIRQMLDKLIENGVAFHTKNTPIELRLEARQNIILLHVSNQGPPIPDNLLPEIFNSMVSARAVKDKDPHLGLGLYIARTIAEHHKGSIKAVNLGDGRIGVCFTIRFPHPDAIAIQG